MVARLTKMLVLILFFGALSVPALAINVDVQDVPVRVVVEGLARSGGINLVVDDTVQGNLTMHLRGVTLDEALQVIADSQDLLYERQGAIRIITGGRKNKQAKTLVAFPLAYASPKEAQYAVSALLPEAEVRTYDADNSLVAGVTKREAAQVQALLSKIDVPPKQVNVEVEVVALNRDAMKELGINWDWTTWQHGAGHVHGFTYEGQVHALETQGKAKILARPHMLAMNGKEAKILIGDRVPVLTERTKNGETSTTTEYTDAGIKLTYIPWIHQDGTVTANVQAEVSTPVFVPEMKAYRIMTRQAQTEVRVQAGKTLVIGGLIDRETVENFSKIPLLGDLPLIGRLFRNHYQSNKETEIVMMIKADIVTI